MSNLGLLTVKQEDYLFDELREKLSTKENNEFSMWPTDYLKRENIKVKLSEKELKVLNIITGDLVKNMSHHGPTNTFYGKVCDTRYDFNKGLKQIIETLRIRQKEPWTNSGLQNILSIKKKNIDTLIKNREEFEVGLRKPGRFEAMFQEVGLIPLPIKEKIRQSFLIHDYKLSEDIIIDVDDYYQGIPIPTLAEIEGSSYEVIMKWIRILGLERKESPIVNWSSRQMLRYYHQWPGEPHNATKKLLVDTFNNGNGNGNNGQDKKNNGKKVMTKSTNGNNGQGKKSQKKAISKK